MNRAGALAAATAIVDKASQPVMNERGYKADGWKPPTLAERTEAIVKLAEFLMLPEPPEPHGRLISPPQLLCDSCLQPMDGLPGRNCETLPKHY